MTGGNVSFYNQTDDRDPPDPGRRRPGVIDDVTTAVPVGLPPTATRSSCSDDRRRLAVPSGRTRRTVTSAGARRPST
ncbi:hypothetical protein HBB16_05410 [Pseudonocardia sp. MCCB 268]|nr:hypothetical protein [Pseudonocardia cytotoxica]